MIRGYRQAWLGALWAALMLPLGVLFVLSIPAVHERKLAPSPAVRAGLEELDLPVPAYAGWWTVTQIAFGLTCFVVAALIVWRRLHRSEAWFVALFLVALGTANAPNMDALVWRHPGLSGAATVAAQALMISLVLFLFTFPDGRFHPRWSRLVVVAVVAGLVSARGPAARPLSEALYVALVFALAAGIASQVHRYRRVSTADQREQTRWVTIAMGVAVAAQVLFPLLEGVPALARPGAGAALLDMASVTGISAAFALIPIALAVAVLRLRLWALDVVVNRAIVYGASTATLLAVYVVVVTGVGRSLDAGGNAGPSLLGAAVVALAFAPLRHRIQRGVNRLMYGDRVEPYRVLSALGQRLEATVAPQAVLQTIVDTVASAIRSPYVAIAVPRGDELEVAASTGTAAAETVVLPLVHQHQRVGELRLAARTPGQAFNSADHALLDDLARQAGAAVHAVDLTRELQVSRERLVTAREEERRRLRRDLHDGLGPALASMTLQAEAAGDLIEKQPEVAATILSDLAGQLQASTADIRRLVYDLRPPALDELGLTEALRSFVARFGTSPIRVRADLPDRMPPMSAAAEVAIYRIVQEAVANVVRHSHAVTCDVTIRADDQDLTVQVVDDGVGIPDGVTEGVGMRSMRERAGELGGSCAVSSNPGGGTDVRVNLPRTAPAVVSG